MSTHVTFAPNALVPDTGSLYPIGTAFLRPSYQADVTGLGLIAVGSAESISIKQTGEELELEGEDAATEAFLMMNNGEAVTINARFTKDVPTPKKGQFIALKRRKSTMSAVTAGTFTDATVFDSFLITDVGEDYGSKAVAKYSITARKWDSLGVAQSPRSAVVTTSTGALDGAALAFPVAP